MTVVSHGAERQASAFKKFALSVEPVHKVDHQQYRSLLKKICMPVVRGPENRHGFASFEEKNSNSFLKFNPFTSPVEPNYPLFPHEDDVPLVDPCSGFVSAGPDADLQPSVGRAIESLVDYSDWRPHQQVPITGKRGQPAHKREMILLEETSQDRRWNSRAVSAASVRARLRGWRTPVKVAPALPDQNHIFAFCMDPNLKVVGGFWDTFQMKSFTPPQIPVDFACVGAVYFEDIDNADVDLIPLNRLRTSKPPYTSTACTPNIPGYTGKVRWSATHPANSNLPSTTPSIIA